MIRSLFIKNFTLVEEASVSFTEGLNIITGETGAGKSILVNAIGQLCGERSSPDLIRKGASKAIIELSLCIKQRPDLLQLIEELELEIENTSSIILRKEINANGSSRVFVNDSPVTLSRLGRFSSLLLDLHGQHQHQRLLHPENHLFYLDDFGELETQVTQFNKLLKAYRGAEKNRDALKEKQLRAYQMQDMYRYQNEELQKANLDAEELDLLRDEIKRISNQEALHTYGSGLTHSLYTGDINASELLSHAESHLKNLSELDDQFKAYLKILSEAREAIEEIGRFTDQYLNTLQFDPERMEFVHQRLAQLEFLLKKYQKSSIGELLDFHKEIGGLLGGIAQFNDDIEDIEKEMAGIKNEIEDLGAQISAQRKNISAKLREAITPVLGRIGMPHARFTVKQTLNLKEDSVFKIDGQSVSPGHDGFDQILFEIASNAGESFKPLHKVASGGEISRIMLALKSVLAESDRVPSLVFDEIDSGISGKIAQIVGKKLLELGKHHQIICVTHLPQIAAFANSHYKVLKYVEDSRTFVDIEIMDNNNKLKEIAKLLGGRDLSREALENARHLINESAKL